jgi:hypothetical protein
MMKKLLTAAVLLVSFSAANAQNFKVVRKNVDANSIDFPRAKTTGQSERTASTSTLTIPDTLWYFYNKQRFINTSANQAFYTIQGSVGTTTNGDLTEFGSSFLNSSATTSVTVSDVAFFASRQTNSTNTVIPVRVYF